MAVERYQISDWSKVGQLWRRYTALSPTLLHIDFVLSDMFGFLMIDVPQFEMEIWRLYPQYDREHTSLEEIVGNEFGDNAVNLINSLL